MTYYITTDADGNIIGIYSDGLCHAVCRCYAAAPNSYQAESQAFVTWRG